MNRYILSPCDSELFDFLENWLTLPWIIPWSHSQDSQDCNTLTNVRKRTLAKPARNNLMTQSVTNLTTQPEKQPGYTARKTTWRHSQKNDLHQTWRVGSIRWTGGHLHRESAIEWRPSTNWLPSASDPKPPPLNKPK